MCIGRRKKEDGREGTARPAFSNRERRRGWICAKRIIIISCILVICIHPPHHLLNVEEEVEDQRQVEENAPSSTLSLPASPE
jgi:hypothetical protein